MPKIFASTTSATISTANPACVALPKVAKASKAVFMAKTPTAMTGALVTFACGYPMFVEMRERFVTQLCLQIWLRGTSALLASP